MTPLDYLTEVLWPFVAIGFAIVTLWFALVGCGAVT